MAEAMRFLARAVDVLAKRLPDQEPSRSFEACSMSRRRRQGLSPSLFPFLAVLVCTLGTLILLLALVAENATAAANRKQELNKQAAANDAVAAAGPPRMSSGIGRRRSFARRSFASTSWWPFATNRHAELASRRDEMTHLDDHIDRLRQQISQLNEEVRRGDRRIRSVFDQRHRDRRDRSDKIDAEERSHQEASGGSSRPSPRVVIVPHKGPNGTDRRPVYLECRADGITIRPEGSQIPLEFLENAGYSANPLDAALRTIRMHVDADLWRLGPSLSIAGGAAGWDRLLWRGTPAMQDWDDQFGYELVPAEVKLAFAKPDPNLKRRSRRRDQHCRRGATRSDGDGQSSLGGRGSLGGTVPRIWPIITNQPSYPLGRGPRSGRASQRFRTTA